MLAFPDVALLYAMECCSSKYLESKQNLPQRTCLEHTVTLCYLLQLFLYLGVAGHILEIGLTMSSGSTLFLPYSSYPFEF